MDDWKKSWSLTRATYDFIRCALPDGKCILELGSGWGTSKLSEHYVMNSIEDNEHWLNKYESEYIHAKIIPYDKNNPPPDIPGLEKLDQDEQFGWYDINTIIDGIKDIDYDMIFVDGPKARIGRGGFLVHLDKFKNDVPIIIDDTCSRSEYILMEKVAQELGKEYVLVESEKKDHSFGLINFDRKIIDEFLKK
jgi:hypothetical protein